MADNEFCGRHIDGFIHPGAVPHALTCYDRQRHGRILLISRYRRRYRCNYPARFSISKVIANSNILLILGIYVTTSFQTIFFMCKAAWSRRIKIHNLDPWAVKCVYRNVDLHCTSAGGQKGPGQVRVHDRVEEAKWLLFLSVTGPQLGMAVMRQLGKGMSFNLRSDSARGNRVYPRSWFGLLQPTTAADWRQLSSNLAYLWNNFAFSPPISLGSSRTQANYTWFHKVGLNTAGEYLSTIRDFSILSFYMNTRKDGGQESIYPEDGSDHQSVIWQGAVFAVAKVGLFSPVQG